MSFLPPKPTSGGLSLERLGMARYRRNLSDACATGRIRRFTAMSGSASCRRIGAAMFGKTTAASGEPDR
jgi:hypothetical protein